MIVNMIRFNGILLIGFFLKLPMSHGSFFEDQVRLGTGVHFITQNRAIVPSIGSTTLAFAMTLPKLPPPPHETFVTLLNDKIKKNLPPDIVDSLTEIHELFRHLTRVHQDIKALTKELSPSPPPRRRGLVNFVGDFSKSLFGLATEKDIQQIYSHLETLRKESISDQDLSAKLKKGIIELRDKFQMLSQYVNTSITTNKQLNRQYIGFRHLFATFREATEKEMQTTHRQILMDGIRIIVVQHRALYVQSLNHFLNWQASLLTLQHGQLPAHLVPYSSIQTGLEQLQSAQRHHQQDSFTIQTGDHLQALYYDTISARTRVFHDHIIITAHVPLITSTKVFDTYKIKPIPNPIPQSSAASTQASSYTLLKGLPTFLLISRTGQEYTQLEQEQFDSCIGTTFRVCSNILHVFPIHLPSCASAIFFQQAQDIINKLCTFQLTNKPLQSSVEFVGSSRYLLINTSVENHIQCPHKPIQYLRPVITQLVQLTCGCRLVIKNDVLTSSQGYCRANSSITVYHPLNSPILHHFDALLTDYGESTLANTTDKDLPIIPELGDLDSALSQISQDDIEFTTDLDRLDPEDILTSLPSMEYDASQEHIIIYVLIALGGIVELLTVLALIWLMLKVRVLKGTIIAMTIDKTKANPLFPGTETHQSATKDILWIIPVIMLIYLLIYILKAALPQIKDWLMNYIFRNCYHQCLSFTADRVDIYISLSDRQDQVLMFLNTIVLQNGEHTMKRAPICTKVTVNRGILRTTLRLQWEGTLTIQTNGHSIEKDLPKSIKVDPAIEAMVNKILAQETRIHNLQYTFRNSGLIQIPKKIPASGIAIPTYLTLQRRDEEEQTSQQSRDTSPSPSTIAELE